ncbi:MAG: sugar phosphate nucleotidyltransferase [Polyangiaceae bacterium]
MTADALRAVVLAGGSGTRFWPASRAARPKQLLPLAGDKPMIVETVDRVLPLTSGPSGVLIVSGRTTELQTRALLPGLATSSFLIEPAPRNTAPAIAWASWVVAREAPDAVLAVLPSDHHVADVVEFRRVLGVAADVARRGAITTIGITPTRPETGFGYLEVKASGASEGEAKALAVHRFVEKPDHATAQAYLASGRHYWNAGMFVFRARDMQQAVRRHLPDVAALLDELDVAARVSPATEAEVLSRIFVRMPSISIDYAVMEKEPGLMMVPGAFGWSDVGSWQAAWELADKDAAGNAASASTILADASGNLVVDQRSDRTSVVALVGVSNTVVVLTDDAALIVPRERSQDVRRAVEILARDRPDRL